MLDSQVLLERLKKFDKLYEGFYTWLAGQYAPEYGGFYYARSSRTDPQFQPDIESTAQALSILQRSRLLGSMPELMRQQLIAFFQKRQTPEGYFYDPHNRMREVDRMVGRAVMYSAGSLRLLGAKPLYPLPGSSGRQSLPPHLQSLAAFKQWIDERPWDYAWMACDNLQAAGVFLRQLPENERKEYMDYLWKYLEEHQDPETGMWGDGRPYIKISGAFKLALLYGSFQKTLPRPERIYRYLLYTLREDVSEDMCWTRNPMDLLCALKPVIGPYPLEEAEEIIEITFENLKRYLKPDGGFSRHVEHSLEIPNNVPLGKGLAEGDMNAGTQALRIRSACYEFINMQRYDVPLTQYTDGFYEKIQW